jgi:hypothetical protein
MCLVTLHQGSLFSRANIERVNFNASLLILWWFKQDVQFWVCLKQLCWFQSELHRLGWHECFINMNTEFSSSLLGIRWWFCNVSAVNWWCCWGDAHHIIRYQQSNQQLPSYCSGNLLTDCVILPWRSTDYQEVYF